MTRSARPPRTPARRPIRWPALLLALTIVGGCGSSGPSSVAAVRFTAADGTTSSLAAFHGTPTIVNLWATWCSPCVKEMPAFDRVAGSTANVRIIGVNVGDTAAAAAAFATKLGVRYPQFTDPDGKLSAALSVSGLPATAFVSADGVVLNVHQGALTEAALRDAIAANFPAPDQKGIAP